MGEGGVGEWRWWPAVAGGGGGLVSPAAVVVAGRRHYGGTPPPLPGRSGATRCPLLVGCGACCDVPGLPSSSRPPTAPWDQPPGYYWSSYPHRRRFGPRRAGKMAWRCVGTVVVMRVVVVVVLGCGCVEAAEPSRHWSLSNSPAPSGGRAVLELPPRQRWEEFPHQESMPPWRLRPSAVYYCPWPPSPRQLPTFVQVRFFTARARNFDVRGAAESGIR